jgi:hypothetical protein
MSEWPLLAGLRAPGDMAKWPAQRQGDGRSAPDLLQQQLAVGELLVVSDDGGAHQDPLQDPVGGDPDDPG